MRLSLSGNEVKALLLCAGDKDTRHYLNGVAIDTTTAGRCFAVATDGHRAMVLNVDLDEEQTAERTAGVYVIPRTLLAQAKAEKRGRLTITIEPGEGYQGRVSIVGIATVSGELIDWRYPDWRRVVPKEASGELAQFNHEYLGEFGKIAMLLGNGYPIAPIAHNGSGGALIHLGCNAFGVCMPVRHDPVAMTPPAWLSADANEGAL